MGMRTRMLIAAGMLALISPAAAARRVDRSVGPAWALPLAALQSRGSSSATLGIIAITNFECDACRLFARRVLPGLEARYLSTGLVRLAFLHLPSHERRSRAFASAVVAECAGEQRQFWPMHDVLFADGARLDDTGLLVHALRLNLDMARYDECLRSTGPMRVREQMDAVKTWRLAESPTFVVGTILENGTLSADHILVAPTSIDAFAEAIDPVLAALVGGRP